MRRRDAPRSTPVQTSSTCRSSRRRESERRSSANSSAKSPPCEGACAIPSQLRPELVHEGSYTSLAAQHLFSSRQPDSYSVSPWLCSVSYTHLTLPTIYSV